MNAVINEAILIVSIFSIEHGWEIDRNVTRIPVRDMAACYALQDKTDKRLIKEKGLQFFTICRLAGTKV